MRTIFIVLMILLALAIAAVAMLNNEIVTVNYLFGQIDLTLFALILGSALAGIVVMVFFSIYRSIHNYIKSEGERGMKKELQRRVKVLEVEKKKLEDDLGRMQKERENAAAKARAELEEEKKKLEDELNRQKRERENAVTKEQAELETEKRKLEDELRKQQKENEKIVERDEHGNPVKKGFWDFLKK
jgi:uncharacterized integral membrane protein